MGVERHHVIGAAICAVLAWLLVTAALPSLRWIPYAATTGFVVALLSITFLVFSTARTRQHGTPRAISRPLPAFITTSAWTAQKAEVELRSQYSRRRLFQSQSQLSSRIDGFLDLITDTFITAWFTNISSKRLFQNEVDRAIRDAITSIQGRVQELDMIEIAVSRIVPVITHHMQEFYTAERLVRGKNLTRDMTESEELDLAIAGKYNNGKLHQAASLAFADTKLMQQAHVRKSIEKILPLVLSDDMLSSPAVLALIREMVACAVLAPVLLILADPDMWNQVFENYGKSILQDRKNVRKLRAALDEHAPASPRGHKGTEIPRLRPHDNERQFERFIRNLRKTPNLAEARRYRSEITSQLRKGADRTHQDPLYMRRLEAGKRILDQKISSLSSLDATSKRPAFSTKASTASTESTNDLTQASLKDILHNASGLSYFMEFMDRRQRMRLVQFWIIVDGFRNPLEGDVEEADITLHEKMTYESSDRMNIKQLRDSYINSPELHIPASSKEAIEAYVNAGKSADLLSYVKARRAILRAQARVYDEMREEHLEAFKKSDLFYKWSASEAQLQSPDVAQSNGQWSDPPRPARPEKTPSQRPKELNDIMDEPPDKDWVISDANTRPEQSNDSPTMSEELFRSPTDSFMKPSIASLGLVTGSSSRGVFTDDLFGHEEERYLEDEKDDPELRPVEDDIHEAAPGDLGLTEAISVLTNDIDRLVAQEKIVDSLTKKAELTNNATELRILRKSRQSLQREIRRKEMQKQQYVVQESDNSLYGRAAVSIKSIMVGKEEDGHEFAIYVIEVRRQAGDQMAAATWTVTRRYSEFHELHKRLRHRFDSVRNLEFPRRQTLFTLQKDFLQRRRLVLERYLRSLLLIPAICRSRELRAFLSQSAIVPTDSNGTKVDGGDLVTRIYNSVSDGMEEFLGNLPMLDQLTVAGQNLISAASAQISGSSPLANTVVTASALPQDAASAAEAEAEINAFEDKESEPFVKPISDLFLEVFELQKGNSWLRGRAVVVVLHQLLGGTVERKIRDTARALADEPSLVRYVDMVREMMWPGGKIKPPSAVRSLAEKNRSRKEAALVLASLIPDMAGSVVGRANAQQASRKIAALLNNHRLNTHLVMQLFDEIVAVVFPEAAAGR
ncbi:hypothetical protein ANO11243_057360 [Dothideomycetidae sp. 11243]|nr:hypothetical protein ANO11243_057360 [fungal sp. No.11243]